MAFAKALREAGFMLEVVWDYDLCNLLTKALLKNTMSVSPTSLDWGWQTTNPG